MADDFFDRLLAASDVQAVLARLLPGGRVVRDEWAVKCPFCNSDEPRDPKFSVNLASTVFKCFKCNETGNAIRLAQMLWGREWQKEWAAASPASSGVLGPQERPGGPRRSEPRSTKTPQEAWEAGQAALVKDPSALEPLAKAWGIPAAWLAAKGVVPTKNGVHPAYGVPAVDPATGVVSDLKRRVLPPVPDGVVKSQSWPGGKAGLFGFGALAEKPSAPVLVAEGEKDWAVAAHDLPEFAVVGIGMGAGCWLPAWTEALRGRRVYLSYDPDKAGVEGGHKAAMALQGAASATLAMPALFAPGEPDAKGKPTWPNGLDLFDYLRGGGAALFDRGVDAPSGLRKALEASVEVKPAFDPKEFLRSLIYSLEEAGDDVDWTFVGEETYRAMNKAGARWLQVEGEVWCIFRGAVCQVSGRDKTWRLTLYDLTNQTSVEKPGQVIAEVVALVATRDAVIPDMTPAWCVRRQNSIYMALHDRGGRQVRITPDTIDIVDNGTDGVVTFPYAEIARPIRVMGDDEFDADKADAALDRLVYTFTCDDTGRVLLRWYFLTMPLFPLSQSHPVLRFRGDSESGKSTCAKALTTLLYGREDVELNTTSAALYRLARKRPLTAIDNLEERRFRGQDGDELQDFLLISATGANRKKSASGSDGGVVVQEVKSLFLSTGIEPVGTDKPEVVNRTVEIHFDRCNRTKGFAEQVNLDQVVADRDLLWNLAFRTCRAALAAVRDGAIQQVMLNFPDTKKRLAEFFALLSIAQVGANGGQLSDNVRMMLEDLHAEEGAAMEAGSQINTLFLAMARVDMDEVGIPCETHGAVWRTEPLRAPDLFRALSVTARKFGLEMPWKSPHSMSARLNDETIRGLAAVGVTVERSRTKDQRLLRVKVNQARLEMEPQAALPLQPTAA